LFRPTHFYLKISMRIKMEFVIPICRDPAKCSRQLNFRSFFVSSMLGGCVALGDDGSVRLPAGYN
jgi:hypothetical protein